MAPEALHVILDSGEPFVRGCAGVRARERPARVLDAPGMPRSLIVAHAARRRSHTGMRRTPGRLELGRVAARAARWIIVRVRALACSPVARRSR
jgi:hypothetical protein